MSKYHISNVSKSIQLAYNVNYTVYRIVADIDFINEATGLVVKKGDNGGYISSERNLSQDGTCWIHGHAVAFGGAEVMDDSIVKDESRVFGTAKIYNSATIKDSATVCDKAEVFSKSVVGGNKVVNNISLVGDIRDRKRFN